MENKVTLRLKFEVKSFVLSRLSVFLSSPGLLWLHFNYLFNSPILDLSIFFPLRTPFVEELYIESFLIILCVL